MRTAGSQPLAGRVGSGLPPRRLRAARGAGAAQDRRDLPPLEPRRFREAGRERHPRGVEDERAGDRAVLTALAEMEAKLGLVLYDMRNSATLIGEILG